MSNQCFPYCEEFDQDTEGRSYCVDCGCYQERSDDYWSQVDDHWQEYIYQKELWDEYVTEKESIED